MYQFLHIETYSLYPKVNKIHPEKSVKSFSSISKELMRHPSATPHIKCPIVPKILHGGTAYDALKLAQERYAISKDALGRKLRKDAQMILSGVISCPEEFKNASQSNYENWLNDNVDYLLKKYGSNLVSVLLHEDESHPHIHFMCVPEPDSNYLTHIKSIHPPIAARENTIGGRKEKYLAYKNAFREMQDEYYSKISCKYGFTRDGAKATRLTRTEYVRKKNIAEKQALVLEKIQSEVKRIEQERELILKEKSSIDTKINNLKKEEERLSLIKKETEVRKKYMLNLFMNRKSKDSEIEILRMEIKRLRKIALNYKEKANEAETEYDNYRKLYLNECSKSSSLTNKNNKLTYNTLRLENEIIAKDKIIYHLRKNDSESSSSGSGLNLEPATPEMTI